MNVDFEDYLVVCKILLRFIEVLLVVDVLVVLVLCGLNLDVLILELVRINLI